MLGAFWLVSGSRRTAVQPKVLIGDSKSKVFVAAPTKLESDVLVQQLVNGVSLGAIYAVFAIGFTLVFGVMNVLNLAQGAVFMWGAYVGLSEVVRTLALPLPLAILAAAMAAGLLGVLSEVIGFPAIATARRASLDGYGRRPRAQPGS